MFSCGFPFIFETCITLDCLEIESPFQRQWIRRTESIPLGLRGRTNFAAGPIKATSCPPVQVRMAERSKAPDSRRCTFLSRGISGLRMEAWVRIPLLTWPFDFKLQYPT